MRLKRLILQGYKTFANKQEFLFDEGITAIVGPNGSGKSNLADALRWVLGEQSYGYLRGKRTSDMIFTGSKSRARASMAQATLTLDNSVGWLPIDYTEVELSRRAYRSGENEYLLNRQKVRLRDITDLLAKAGLGERQYAIIGQGLIDRALSLRAEERRGLFEEAAGITHYKNRRAEALRRLQETQRNLQRVHDILSEIRPRLNSLKRQANRAKNYELVSDDLKHLLREYYGYKWKQTKIKLREKRQIASSFEKAWQESRQWLTTQQTYVGQLREKIAQWQTQERIFQQRRDRLREDLDQTRRQIAVGQERQLLLQKQLEELKNELPALHERHQLSRSEWELALTSLTEVQAQLAEEKHQMSTFMASFQQQQTKIKQCQKQISQLEREQTNHQRNISQLEGQLTQLRERVHENEVPSTNEDAIKEANEHIGQLKGQVSQAKEAVNIIQRQQDRSGGERQKLTHQLKLLRQESHQINKHLTKLQKELGRLEARVDLLEQMRQKEIKTPKDVTILGQFAQFITIPTEYQIALAMVLESDLTTLILPNQTQLWAMVTQQKQNVSAISAEDALPASSPPHPTHTGVIGWARELVTVQENMEAVADVLLNCVLLVDQPETAYAVAQELPAGCVAVATSGVMVKSGGVVVVRPQVKENSVLAREKAWREAVELQQVQIQAVKQAQQQVSSVQNQLNTIQADIDQYDQQAQKGLQQEKDTRQHLEQATRQLDRAEQKQRYLIQQQEQQIQTQKRLVERIAGMEQQLEREQGAYQQVTQSLQTVRDTLANLPVTKLKQEQQAWQQRLDATRTIVAGREAVVDSRQTTLKQIAGQLQQSQMRQTALEKELSSLDLTQAQAKQSTLATQLQGIADQLKPIWEGIEDKQQRLVMAERENAGIQRIAHEHENQLTQAKIALSQQENQIENLKERINADLGLVALSYDEDENSQEPLPLAEVVETLPTVEELPADIETEIQKYRAQLKRMGAINPDAPQEYDETQTRFDFLSQQVEDLNETEEQLRSVITELDDLTSRAFAETVQKVDVIFSKMFNTLFGGGSANLVLTEPDSLTLSGVDILAQLPNRRQQALGLLSGGERSLTAAALIFALLKVSPTPFCVMDEVDAMLDEANVNRFIDVVRELSLDSQFIMITHNRGTVQAAQTVYGISMGTDSTSRVISIKPEDYISEQMSLPT